LSDAQSGISSPYKPESLLNLPRDMRVAVQRRFACLTYHVIGQNGSQYTLGEAQFRAHLAVLRSECYVVDDFQGLEARLRSDSGIADRYVVLTIDDGHESSMRAAEILLAHGFRATLFLTRDRCLKKSHFIRENQVQELRNAGFSVGTHGTTHRRLTFMSEPDCIEELKGSKQWLEDVIGEEVRYMAAPGGYINSRVLQLINECGYVLTGTCRERMNSAETITLPGEVNRVNMRQHFSSRHFRKALEGDAGFYAWRQFRAATLTIPKKLLR
jgi:peptidoglycan/xylan/chitin deacetylase (PgdA/CDA1 family)